MPTKRQIKRIGRGILNVILWLSWVKNEDELSSVLMYGFIFPTAVLAILSAILVRSQISFILVIFILYVLGSSILNLIRFLWQNIPEGGEEDEKPKRSDFIYLEDGEETEIIEDDYALPEKRKRS